MATFSGRVDPTTGRYFVQDAAAVRAAYQRDGWVTLRGFLSEAEIRPIEVIYDKFMVRRRPADLRSRPTGRPAVAQRRNEAPRLQAEHCLSTRPLHCTLA